MTIFSSGNVTPTFSEDSNPGLQTDGKIVRFDSEPLSELMAVTEQSREDFDAATRRLSVSSVEELVANSVPIDEFGSHNKPSIHLSAEEQTPSHVKPTQCDVQQETDSKVLSVSSRHPELPNMVSNHSETEMMCSSITQRDKDFDRDPRLELSKPELLLSCSDDVMHQLFGEISDSEIEDCTETSKPNLTSKATHVSRLKSEFEDGEIVESDSDRSRVLKRLKDDKRDHGKTLSSSSVKSSKSRSPESSKYDNSRSKRVDLPSCNSKKGFTQDVPLEKQSRSNKEIRDRNVSRHSDERLGRKDRHERRSQVSPDKSFRGSHSSGKPPRSRSRGHRSPLRARADENGRHVSSTNTKPVISGDRKSAKSRISKR